MARECSVLDREVVGTVLGGKPAVESGPRRPGKTEENHDRTIQTHNFLVVESAYAGAEFALRNRRELINHQTAGGAKPIAFGRCHRNAEERRFSQIRRERTYCY